MHPTRAAAARQKELGAFYTDDSVVRFLVEWALAGGTASVMDPSCGDGRFLAAASSRGCRRLVGCDVSGEALSEARARIGAASGLELVEGDFFALRPEGIAPVGVILGNPPFIRYQRFADDSRRRALESALRVGVRLSRLTSTWAPFLLHAIQFLVPGGRLGMVVPAEITRTHYGLRTLRGLLRHFASIRLLTFERNFFADAQTETCLLLAEGFGGRCGEVTLVPLESIADLEGLAGGAPAAGGVRVAMADGVVVRFAEAYLDGEQRKVWRRAGAHPEVRSLGQLATVVNGYVTGDNELFHRTRAAALAAGMPPTWLLAAVRSSRSLRGLAFTADDLAAREDAGVAHHLVVPQEDLFLASSRQVLDRFLADGEARGTPRRFKCRSRNPWWRVPGLQRGDVVVAYMAGREPRAALNSLGAVFTNALHGLRLRDPAQARLVVLGLYSSLARLSLEIEGRSYGGGILKLEPRELDRVLVPVPTVAVCEVDALFGEVDALLRAGREAEAVSRVDEALLRRGLGLSAKAVRALREARERLVERRISRSAAG